MSDLVRTVLEKKEGEKKGGEKRTMDGVYIIDRETERQRDSKEGKGKTYIMIAMLSCICGVVIMQPACSRASLIRQRCCRCANVYLVIGGLVILPASFATVRIIKRWDLRL